MKQLKQEQKNTKDDRKKVFVLKFIGDIRASATKELKDEIKFAKFVKSNFAISTIFRIFAICHFAILFVILLFCHFVIFAISQFRDFPISSCLRFAILPQTAKCIE